MLPIGKWPRLVADASPGAFQRGVHAPDAGSADHPEHRSLLGLVTALCVGQSQQWLAGRGCTDMSKLTVAAVEEVIGMAA